MRVLDLFSGAAGGWTLGLHRAGFETVAACEADPWRRAVYGARWPAVKLYDDVRTLTGERVLADVGAVDLVAGSPPCPEFSTANAKGKGIDSERGALFLDFIRIVGELRPRWVCAENVAGIRTRGADRIIADLEALGYAVWPLVVGAVHAGAPHRRQRVWFVAHAESVGWRRGGKPQSHMEQHGLQSVECGARQGQAATVVADAPSRERPALTSRPVADGSAGAAGRGPDVSCGGGTSPDTNGAALRQQQGRSSGTDGTGAAEPGDDARHPDGSDESTQRSALSRQSASPHGTIGRIAAAWPRWNGGAAGLGDVDDGLPRGVARAALAAFGDAVVPQIAEALGRAILTVHTARAAA